jgi:hypothetical protein
VILLDRQQDCVAAKQALDADKGPKTFYDKLQPTAASRSRGVPLPPQRVEGGPMNTIYEVLARIGYTHPLHPPMTVMPLGMVVGALFFSILALFPSFGKYATTSRHCFTLGFLAVFPTVLLGYMDWQHFYGGHLIFPIKMKMILATALAILMALAVLLLYRRLQLQDMRIFAMQVLCFAVAVTIGYFGGNLVFGGQGPVQAAETSSQSASTASGLTFADVAPIFNHSCTTCHSGKDAPMKLHLDSYDAVMAGSKYGPVIVPGKPDESELVKRIRGKSTPRMPYHKPPLPADEIQRIADWVKQGAKR